MATNSLNQIYKAVCMDDLVLPLIAQVHVNKLQAPYIKMETTEVRKTSLCLKYVKYMVFVHIHVN